MPPGREVGGDDVEQVHGRAPPRGARAAERAAAGGRAASPRAAADARQAGRMRRSVLGSRGAPEHAGRRGRRRRRPARPSRSPPPSIRSWRPPSVRDQAGTPEASASGTTIPNESLREGSTRQSAARRRAASSAWGREPRTDDPRRRRRAEEGGGVPRRPDHQQARAGLGGVDPGEGLEQEVEPLDPARRAGEEERRILAGRCLAGARARRAPGRPPAARSGPVPAALRPRHSSAAPAPRRSSTWSASAISSSLTAVIRRCRSRRLGEAVQAVLRRRGGWPRASRRVAIPSRRASAEGRQGRDLAGHHGVGRPRPQPARGPAVEQPAGEEVGPGAGAPAAAGPPGGAGPAPRGSSAPAPPAAPPARSG